MLTFTFMLSSLPCLHTFLACIPTSFFTFLMFLFLVSVFFYWVAVRPKPKISFKCNHNHRTWNSVIWQLSSGSKHVMCPLESDGGLKLSVPDFEHFVKPMHEFPDLRWADREIILTIQALPKAVSFSVAICKQLTWSLWAFPTTTRDIDRASCTYRNMVNAREQWAADLGRTEISLKIEFKPRGEL